MELKKIIFNLCNSAGPSGQEYGPKKIILDVLKDIMNINTDKMGNIICENNPKGQIKQHILLDAHIDEVGLIVTGFENGFIKVTNVGGLDARILPGTEVIIWGKVPVKGLFCTTPPHLIKAGDKSGADITRFFIDTGLTANELDSAVTYGDRVTFCGNAGDLLGFRFCGKSLDNRVGAAVLIAVMLTHIKEYEEAGIKITILFSAQEETGCTGAITGAYNINPDKAIVIDTTFALSAGCPPHKCGKMSEGPMIGISPSLNKEISEELKMIAKKNNIKYQVEVMAGKTGTNADFIGITKDGIKTGLVSIPIKYMHTSVEQADLEDIKDTCRLIHAFIINQKEGLTE